ncbi:MAG: purine-nucleoside phosphorylase [Clostridia bacterium]|nr:purine-nucleoside phosphorylase [Clostridia bacterium]
MTVHNEAKIGEIAKTVLMPGDPMRAKYIAENFLEDAKLVNKVRGIYAFTGKYKGVEVTVMGSGMGLPSMGIYCYELYKFYNVENIIRIGSCGANSEEIEILDVILAENSYTESNFAKAMTAEDCHIIGTSGRINEVIKETAKEMNQPIRVGNMCATEYFGPYSDISPEKTQSLPQELNILGIEMESFALFYTANHLGKHAACLATVSDSAYRKRELTADEREKSMNGMITLALEAAIKL